MRKIGTYLFLLILFSAPFWWLAAKFGGSLYITGMMFSPTLAAIATVKLTGGSLAQLGWRGCRFRWPIAAWALTLGVITLVNILLIITGQANFPEPQFLAERATKLGVTGWPTASVLAIYFALSMTYGIVGLSANALGEEIGWRGFLTPATYEKWGFTGSALFVGIIWAVWHLPLFIGKAELWEMAAFALGIIGMSFILTWFRLASRSVWPAAILHGIHNAAFLNFWDPLLIVPPGSKWTGESGFGLPIAYALIATAFWAYRGRAEHLWRDGQGEYSDQSLVVDR